MSADLRQLRKWEKSAATLLRKAEALFSDMMSAAPDDEELTDYADNAMNEAEDLCGLIAGRIRRAKRPNKGARS